MNDQTEFNPNPYLQQIAFHGVRIVASSMMPRDLSIRTPDGTRIEGVTKVTITGGACDELTTAVIELTVDKLDIAAHPLLGRHTLEASAMALGLALVPIETVEPGSQL
jgi:hypothetical protein